MAGMMTMRSGNPALTADTFAKYRTVPGAEQMTLGGTVNKTALSLVILLIVVEFLIQHFGQFGGQFGVAADLAVLRIAKLIRQGRGGLPTAAVLA